MQKSRIVVQEIQYFSMKWTIFNIEFIIIIFLNLEHYDLYVNQFSGSK